MGNCLAKNQKRKIKRNAVAPAPEDDVCGRISRASPRPGSRNVNQADMVKQLEDSQYEDSKIATGGVAFVLDAQEGNPERMPSRLASRLDGACTPALNEDKVKYTAEERELLAELFRDDMLREKQEKARIRDVKLYDAAKRRAARKLVPLPEENKAEDNENA